MKSLRIFMALALGLVLAFGMVACGDSSSDNGGSITSASASGEYTYSGLTISMTTTSNTFPADCGGPPSGSFDITLSELTSTTMTWDGDVWTRSGGTDTDIVGVWTEDDSEGSETTTLTFTDNGSWSVVTTNLSCDDDGPTGAPGDSSISGTLTLPTAASGKTYMVFLDTDNDPGNDGYSYSTTGTCGAGITVDYEITDIESGNYYVIAIVYTGSTSDGAPQDGDHYGIYGGGAGTTVTVLSSGSVTSNITLSTYSEM